MKNAFYSILITLFVLPAFVPWLSQCAIHALHDHQEIHHQSHAVSQNEHNHDSHNYDTETQARNHHSINLDIVSFYTDFLHVDLQKTEQLSFNVSTTDLLDFDYTVIKTVPIPNAYELAFAQSREPPDWRWYEPNKTPLYLSTQRLRI